MNKLHPCVAKTFLGLEHVLAQELGELKCQNIKVLNRAVAFETDKAGIYRTNLNSRLSLSILVEWTKFWTRNEDDFYKRMKKVNWSDVLSPEKTFMITTNIPRSKVFTHSQFLGLRAKDAIADYFMEKDGKRPNVDTKNPDVKIHVYINGNHCTVSLDSSGDPLFKRGYRKKTGPAPINEVLAAGIITLSGWEPNQCFYDPMCGSGTFLIEAGMIAHNMPPGAQRRFGFQNWMNYSPALWEHIFEESAQKITDSQIQILGSDIDNKMLEITRENISSAHLEDSISVSKKDFFKSKWTKEYPPFIVFNPPYDKRMKEKDIENYYKRIGDQLKFSYAGGEAWIISSQIEAMKFIGLRPSKKIKLYNGPLECRLNQYLLYKGTKKKMQQNSTNP